MPDRHRDGVIAELVAGPRPPELIGPFRVAADPDDVALFAAVLGLRDHNAVPLTFPISWLGKPEIRKAIEAHCTTPPIHVSQSFDYSRVLAVGEEFWLEVTIQNKPSAPQRVTVQAVVRNSGNGEVMRMESVLHLAAAIPQPTGADRTTATARDDLPTLDIGPVGATDTYRYAAAAADPNPIHFDKAAAHAAGLDAPVVQGMLLMGFFDRALRDWFPGGSFSRVQALFTRPVPVGASIAIAGRPVPPAPRPTQIVRLFAHTGTKELACVGEATLRAGLSSPAA